MSFVSSFFDQGSTPISGKFEKSDYFFYFSMHLMILNLILTIYIMLIILTRVIAVLKNIYIVKYTNTTS